MVVSALAGSPEHDGDRADVLNNIDPPAAAPVLAALLDQAVRALNQPEL